MDILLCVWHSAGPWSSELPILLGETTDNMTSEVTRRSRGAVGGDVKYTANTEGCQ